MLKQRGFAILKYGLLALAIIGALSGLVYAWKSYTDGLVEEGRARGVAEMKAKFADRDNEQLQSALARLQAAEAARKATERKAAAAIVALAETHRKEKQNAEKRTEKLVADARAGALVLRDPGHVGAPGAADGGGAAAGAGGAAAAGPAGAGAGGLSGQAAAFLLELTAEADERARKYNRLLGHYDVLEKTCRGD